MIGDFATAFVPKMVFQDLARSGIVAANTRDVPSVDILGIRAFIGEVGGVSKFSAARIRWLRSFGNFPHERFTS